MSSLIELKDITKEYITEATTLFALNHVSLQIGENELIAILGASGSGKSTMLYLLGLLDRPTQGSYLLKNKEVAHLSDDELSLLRNQSFGFVFQSFFLLPRLTALQNIMLPLLYRNLPTHQTNAMAMAMLEKLHITELANKRPNQMSGGQQQRVAIARALIGNPDIILADEPTGALDSKTAQDVIQLFKKLHREEKRTIIIVTHDVNIAKQCEREITLKDGKIVSE